MEGKLVLGGKIGINMEFSPSFLLVYKSHFKDLKNPKKIPVNKDVFFTKSEQISLEEFLKLEENKIHLGFYVLFTSLQSALSAIG